ncbi:ABC transporter ATP-binding protein [Pedobacter mucosus]|uniref:ABC transporter ATP-binding protein n=1 Tax=Pedobacter mucosus TaxID=2895286 RepID=UPI001EE444BE|nr:ABC transporter ATP-binding protein [Pedobacter mucosus]UKT65263.1 ABC transporter ATP-binding protein [Pedobacter mucosus]
MIKVERASKHFGETKAVKEISFEVKEQENLVLLGTSGCGKTTTLKMINRLINPDSGIITINGKNIQDANPEILRRSIGYVMQYIGLFPHYTIYENIAIVPKLLKWDKVKTDKRIDELIHKLQLPDNCLKLFPNELSGGQQQRVGLARALVADPPVLLMDEPFGALDNVTRANIQAEFKALEELKKKTIVMVTHDVQEAFELADRICLMDKGEIVQIGTPIELLYKPVNDFSRKFFDGQRLALEFKVISLKDISSFLPNEKVSNRKDISENTSIWTAMEQMRIYGGDQLIIKSSNGSAPKSLNFEQLTSAFNQYQNAMNHG